MWAIGEPSGPIEKGTTYIVRPLHAAARRGRSASSRISAGSRQLLVGPASSSCSEQMKVRSSTRATSPGRSGRGRSSGAWPRRGARRCRASTSWLRRAASYSSAEPSHQWTASGWVRSAISSTQSRSFACVVGAAAAMVWLIRGTLFIDPADCLAEVDDADIGVLVADLQGRRLRLAVGEVHGASEGGARFDLLVGGTFDRGDFSSSDFAGSPAALPRPWSRRSPFRRSRQGKALPERKQELLPEEPSEKYPKPVTGPACPRLPSCKQGVDEAPAARGASALGDLATVSKRLHGSSHRPPSRAPWRRPAA